MKKGTVMMMVLILAIITLGSVCGAGDKNGYVVKETFTYTLVKDPLGTQLEKHQQIPGSYGHRDQHGHKTGLHVIEKGDVIARFFGQSHGDHVGRGPDHGAVAAEAGSQGQGPPQHPVFRAGDRGV